MMVSGACAASFETSLLAAEAIAPSAGALRQQVFDFLQARLREGDGATDEEMQITLNMTGNTQRPRRRELVQMLLVEASTVRRLTRAGNLAVVWVATISYPMEVAGGK